MAYSAVWSNLTFEVRVVFWTKSNVLKFIYSEKAATFCKIFTLLLSYVMPVKSKVKISQNFVAFSEYMNFKIRCNGNILKSITSFKFIRPYSNIGLHYDTLPWMTLYDVMCCISMAIEHWKTLRLVSYRLFFLRLIAQFFTQIYINCFVSWTNWVNSGKLMDNFWISCQFMADVKKVYDNSKNINL